MSSLRSSDDGADAASAAPTLVGLLTLTHSSRRTNLDRCSVQFLERRFGDPRRLGAAPAFAALPPAAALYSGGVSFYRVERRAGAWQVRWLGARRSRERIQHAAFADARHLLVGFEHHLETWRLGRPAEAAGNAASRADAAHGADAADAADGADTAERLAPRDFALAGRTDHPHLAGLHTVAPLPGGGAVLACSAADAILVVDAAGTVTRSLPLPAAHFPRAWPLTSGMDLRRHYVPDAWQAAHLNAAAPDRSGRWTTVSTLIQGAIGVYDLARERYEEVTRGFVGCHGARFDDAGRIYFADSTAGALVTLDANGRIARRFALGSRWLHDVQQLAGSVYAFADAERNELTVHDVERGTLLYRRAFVTWPWEGGFPLARLAPRWLGNSVQALSFYPLPPPPTA